MSIQTGTPKFRQVEDFIRDKIISGEWKPGDKIPSIKMWVEGADADGNSIPKASWGTLRGALITLKVEGWIVGQQGEGTFVAERNPHVLEQKEKQAAAVAASKARHPSSQKRTKK